MRQKFDISCGHSSKVHSLRINSEAICTFIHSSNPCFQTQLVCMYAVAGLVVGSKLDFTLCYAMI